MAYTTPVAPDITQIAAVQGTVTAIFLTPTSQTRPPHGQIWPRGSKA